MPVPRTTARLIGAVMPLVVFSSLEWGAKGKGRHKWRKREIRYFFFFNFLDQRIDPCEHVHSSKEIPCCYILLRTEKSFPNLIKSTRNQIVFTIFRLIWNSKWTCLFAIPNQSENDKYNLISVWFDKIPLCVRCCWMIVSNPRIREKKRFPDSSFLLLTIFFDIFENIWIHIFSG